MDAFSIIRHLLKPVPRFDRMINVLGVKERITTLPDSPAVLRRAENRCTKCTSPGACEEWLDGNDSATASPDYCRNHDLFARLIEQMEKERQIA
jgi:hypothetical protein